MAKKPVTMAMRDEDLKALDEFAVPRRLSRGDAVGVLLEERVAVPTSPSVASRAEVADAGDIARAIKAEALKQALKLTEKRLGVSPVVIEGDQVVPAGDEDTYIENLKKKEPDGFDQSPEKEWDY